MTKAEEKKSRGYEGVGQLMPGDRIDIKLSVKERLRDLCATVDRWELEGLVRFHVGRTLERPSSIMEYRRRDEP